MLLISGNSNIDLSNKISKSLNQPLVNCCLDKFKNGETRIEIKDSIRGKDIVIIQSGYSNSKDINDIVMETALLIDACRRSMAKNITLVMPFYPYARQDRKDSSRAPISAAFIANMLELAGINRIVCNDLHSSQIQGFFRCPVDNLYTIKLIYKRLNVLYKINDNRSKFVLISPDAGAVKRTLKFAKIMGLKTLIMHKERDYSNPGIVSKTILICDGVDDFSDKVGIITDDMIDSGGTFIKACESLINKGFKEIIGVITHGLFTGKAIENIEKSDYVKKIIVTNTICQNENIKKCSKLEVVDISSQLSEAIKIIHKGGSLSLLF